MIVTASSRPSVFSFGDGRPRPYERNSLSPEPPPRPRISRPPERASSVAAIFARSAGGRKGTPSTRLAMPMREVDAAIQVSIVHVS